MTLPAADSMEGRRVAAAHSVDNGRLLSRAEFRARVFARDRRRCVRCAAPAQDAHHILERRLFDDGGHYVDNGVAVCASCHLDAETTVVSCEALRAAAGINRVVLPQAFYADAAYTKWGDVVLPDGTRAPGPLFHDASVQRVLRAAPGVLALYRREVKHPRTLHLPWSPGVHADDRVLADLGALHAATEVVVSEKLDGEQTSLYRHAIHARSLSWTPHPTRTWVKNRWARLAADIPPGWRVCAENLWAAHSIVYTDLDDFLFVHSVWDDTNTCLSWDDTVEWAQLLGLPTVPVLHRGAFDEAAVQRLWTPAQWHHREGYVVRDAEAFPYREFHRRVGKFVRPGHVQSTRHWLHGQTVVRNRLRAAPVADAGP